VRGRIPPAPLPRCRLVGVLFQLTLALAWIPRLDRRTGPGDYPVTVVVNCTRTVLNEAICVVPVPGKIPLAPRPQRMNVGLLDDQPDA